MLVPLCHLRGILTLFLLGLMTLVGMAEDMDCLREYPALYSTHTGGTGESRDQRASQTHALIGARLLMTPEAVSKALASVLEDLRQKKEGAAKIDRARVSFVDGLYEQTVTLALETGDAAHRAVPRRPESIIEALRLAAFASLELSRFEDAVQYLGVALGETSADRDLKLWTQLQTAMARAYSGLKMFKDEEQTLRLIYTEHERIRGERDPETIKHHSEYAGLLYQNGRDADAERETRDVLKITEIVHGPKHEQTQILRKNLARVLEVNGRAAEGEALRRQVVAVQMETLGDGAAGTLRSREQLVKNLFEQKKFGEAQAEALILAESSGRANGPDSATTLGARVSVVLSMVQQGTHEQALEKLEILQADCVRALGEEHPHTLHVRHATGTCFNALRKYAQAEAVLADVVEIRKRVLPVDHLDTVDTQHQLALALLRQRKLKRALTEIRIVTSSYGRLLKAGDPRIAAINQASEEFIAIEEGKQIVIGEVSAIVQERVRQLGPDQFEALNLRSGLAAYMSDVGDAKGALALYKEVLAGCLRTLGRKNISTVNIMQKIGMMQQVLGQYAEAEQSYREVLELRPKLVKAGDATTEEIRFRLGLCLGTVGRFKESEQLVESSYLAVKDRTDVNPAMIEEMKRKLGHIRLLGAPRPLEVDDPGTLNHSLSLTKSDASPASLISGPSTQGSSAPHIDPATLVPSGTIQKSVDYKP